MCLGERHVNYSDKPLWWLGNIKKNGELNITKWFVNMYRSRCVIWRGTQWHSWWKHCTTSWKAAGSIPSGVTGIFHWHNPSSRTMALRSTQPLTEMSTSNIYWGVKQLVCTADNLTTFMCRLSWNLGASTSWKPHGLSRIVMGIALPFICNLDQQIRYPSYIVCAK